MSYISSSSISVFPSALRTTDASGKYTSEPNLTQILRSVTDKDSFIISSTSTASEIVVHGYYFKLTGIDVLTTYANKYACIKLDSSGRLVGDEGETTLDSSGNFIGLSFEDNASGDYSLKMISGNYVKFDGSKIYITVGSGSTATTMSLADFINSKFTATGDSTHGVYVDSSGSFVKVDKVAEAAIADTASTATKLTSGHSLWGQTFEGDNNVSGAISSTGSITPASTDVSDIGSSSLKYKDVYAANLKGNADTATTATTLTTSNFGTQDIQATSAKYETFKLVDGAPTKGSTITFSSSTPDNPVNGDIWFKI